MPSLLANTFIIYCCELYELAEITCYNTITMEVMVMITER
jgi:hypothetical protein